MNSSYSTSNTKHYSYCIVELLRQFGVECSKEQIKTIRQLPTEEAVNRYKLKLLKEAFEK